MTLTHGPVAQGIEHRFPKPGVDGSNPPGVTSTYSRSGNASGLLFLVMHPLLCRRFTMHPFAYIGFNVRPCGNFYLGLFELFGTLLNPLHKRAHRRFRKHPFAHRRFNKHPCDNFYLGILQPFSTVLNRLQQMKYNGFIKHPFVAFLFLSGAFPFLSGSSYSSVESCLRP